MTQKPKGDTTMIWVYRDDHTQLLTLKAQNRDRCVADTVKRLLLGSTDEAIKNRIADGDFDDVVKERVSA